VLSLYRSTNKKRRRIQLGLYPDLSLKKARQVRDDFKDNNFSFEKDTISNVITFRKVGRNGYSSNLRMHLMIYPAAVYYS
jgi:hypothetical protein